MNWIPLVVGVPAGGRAASAGTLPHGAAESRMIRARLVGSAGKPVRTRTRKAAAGANWILIVTGTVVFRVVVFIKFRRRHGRRGCDY